MKQFIAGNWKMHGLAPATAEFDALLAAAPFPADVAVFPPLTLLGHFAAHAAGRIVVGAQDVSAVAGEAARTGEVSAQLLAEAGARAVIVGHSERREHHREDDALIRAKALAAQQAGLLPIICVGETGAERDAGAVLAVIARQLADALPASGVYAVAYEPVWAIGTGATPTSDQIAHVHAAMRAHTGPSIRLLYGGSVKPANATAILALPNVDGALVGGASLRAQEFLAIIGAARPA